MVPLQSKCVFLRVPAVEWLSLAVENDVDTRRLFPHSYAECVYCLRAHLILKDKFTPKWKWSRYLLTIIQMGKWKWSFIVYKTEHRETEHKNLKMALHSSALSKSAKGLRSQIDVKKRHLRHF